MLIRLFIALAALTASAAGFAGEGQAPVVLKPSSDWYMDYGDSHCRLARQFGTGSDKTVFYLEQYEPGDRFTVLAASPKFPFAKLRKPGMQFGPGGATAGSDKVRGSTMGEYGTGMIILDMPLLPDPAENENRSSYPPDSKWFLGGAIQKPVDLAAVKAITHLDLVDGTEPLVRLSFGSMENPVRAMNACTDELLTHWGLDIAEHRTRTRAPYPAVDPLQWLKADDYPVDLLRANKQGIVWFRLNIDEKGTPTDCEVQQQTDPPAFGKLVCQMISKRARFKPALNAQGQPMKSYWRWSASFMIPK